MMEMMAHRRISAGPLESKSHVAGRALQITHIEKPRILLVATLRWPLAARLAIVFNKLGASICTWCPVGHPLEKTHIVERQFNGNPLAQSSSLRDAINLAKPDFIIPCDDDSAILLYFIYQRCRQREIASDLCSLIERSLGRPASCSLAAARGYLMQLGVDEGVRVPLTVELCTASDLEDWGTQHGFPAVLKVDNTWGGLGVSVVRNIQEARCAYSLAKNPAILRAFTHLMLRRDPSYVFRWMQRVHPVITIQKYIVGRSANHAVACWKGEVLSEISAVALKTQTPTGPASVIQIVHSTEMSESARRMITALGLSGLCGLDFVIEATTGNAYLIEMNPRGTPICHVDLGAGSALATALYGRISGKPVLDKVSASPGDVIAMFPGEWRRNPKSHYLTTAFHDVPWVEKELVHDCMALPWEERGLVARIRAHLNPSRIQNLNSSAFSKNDAELFK